MHGLSKASVRSRCNSGAGTSVRCRRFTYGGLAMKNARFATILCAVAVLLCRTGGASGAALSIPNMSGTTGAAAVIPVNVDDATGIAGYQFTITYNASGPVLNCMGTLDGSLTLAASGWVTSQNMTFPNQIIVGGFQDDNIPLAEGSGSLVQLNCTMMGGSGAATNVCIASKKLTNYLGLEIPSETSGNGCGIVTVTSTCFARIVRQASPTGCYQTIQAAYDAPAQADDVIQVQAVDLAGDLIFDWPVSFTLEGGFSPSFTDNPGQTTVHGVLTISDGTAAVENIVIR